MRKLVITKTLVRQRLKIGVPKCNLDVELTDSSSLLLLRTLSFKKLFLFSFGGKATGFCESRAERRTLLVMTKFKKSSQSNFIRSIRKYEIRNQSGPEFNISIIYLTK